MNRWLVPGILIAIVLLVDLYVFQAWRAAVSTFPQRWRQPALLAYWLPVAGLAVLLLAVLAGPSNQGATPFRSHAFALFVGLFLAKLLAALFFLTDDMRRAVTWVFTRIGTASAETAEGSGAAIPRSVFLSWLGFASGGLLFGSMALGFRNKYRYRTERVRVESPHLPDAFRGLRIVHISDIHSGSLTDPTAVSLGVQRILDESPDIILFTGDLVNDHAGEMDGYLDIFSRLKAPMGVYSCLGNHDYGDYRRWPSPEAKSENLERLKAVHASMGWRLLMNEHVTLERDGQRIALLGIENWGAKGFGKYGRLSDAYRGAEEYPFRILLSHDPSHWEAQVLSEYPDIDLMLSGHTHGMQFGVEIPGFRWSPVQYVYRHWAGLYRQGRQFLYVNRGFGFLGYPGRVGILPEITVIELA